MKLTIKCGLDTCTFNIGGKCRSNIVELVDGRCTSYSDGGNRIFICSCYSCSNNKDGFCTADNIALIGGEGCTAYTERSDDA